MIDLILGQTIVPILQDLAWTDQIGWMAIPWTRKAEIGEGQFKDIIHPVAKYVTNNDCEIITGNLSAILTDVGYQSMILISTEGDMSSELADNIAMRRAINIEQDFSINVWMNDAQGATHIASGELMKAFFRKTFKNIPVNWHMDGSADTTYDIYINKLRIQYLRTIDGNPFSQYSFATDQAQFQNRYSAFGMVFKMTGLIFPNCLPAYPDLTHPDCNPDNTITFTVTDSADQNDICSGATATLHGVVTGGSGTITYQWQRLIGVTWTDIVGANSADYTTGSLSGPEGTTHTYRLKATRRNWTFYSDGETITVNDQPEITIAADPTTFTVSSDTTILSEVTGGIGINSYQWQKLIDDNWIDIDEQKISSFNVDGPTWGVGVHTLRLEVTQDPGCIGVSDQIVITITA